MSRSIFTTLITLLITAAAVLAAPDTYIVGGEQVEAGDFSYFVEVNGCGGALIEKDVVLTAAHCGNKKGQQVIISSYHKRTLDSGAQARICVDWVQHPGYNDPQKPWDAALCKLDAPVTIYGDATLDWHEATSLDAGDELIVMGYGGLQEGARGPQYLHAVAVDYITNNRCKRNDMYGSLITDDMLCAGLVEGGKDSCQGDSGGPIVKRVALGGGKYKDHHVGIVSYGSGCARPNKPGVYARTSEMIPFIEDTLCNRFNSEASICTNYTPPPAPAPCDEAELIVFVETDSYGTESGWTLKEEGSDVEIMKLRYGVSFHSNSHEICVNKMACYNFNMTDVYGDGMCWGTDCGFYELSTPGEDPFQRGSVFTTHELTPFCIDNEGKKVDELPVVVAPPEDEQVPRRRGRKNNKKAKKNKKRRNNNDSDSDGDRRLKKQPKVVRVRNIPKSKIRNK